MTPDDEFYEGLGYRLGIFPVDRAGFGPPCEDVDEDHDVLLPVGGGEWAEDVTDDFIKGTRGGEWCNPSLKNFLLPVVRKFRQDLALRKKGLFCKYILET